jgi:hypothetical protein
VSGGDRLLPKLGLALDELLGSFEHGLAHPLHGLHVGVAGRTNQLKSAHQFLTGSMIDGVQELRLATVEHELNEHQHDREAKRNGRRVERDVQTG